MRMRRCRTSVGLVAVATWATAVCHGQPAATGPTSGPATTTTAATQPVDADVAALVRQLGADDEADRAAAQRQLVELGSTAADAVRAAADHDPDPEVRSRAAAVVAQVRDRDANGPTLISLHARDQDAGAVCGQIGKQAHAEIAGFFPSLRGLGNGGATATIDADRQPFWDVMTDLCGQLNVCPTLTDTAGRGTLRLLPAVRNWIARSPHQVVGPFWVGVAGLERLSTVDLEGPPQATDVFFARLIVYPEPKLVVTQVSPLDVREATDDAGNSLLPAIPAVGGRVARAGGRVVARTVVARTVVARLRYPADHPGRRITTLAGDLTVTLAQGAQRLEADVVMGRPVVTRPLQGVRVRVGVNRQGTMYQVTVECDRAGMPDEQWYAMTNRVNDLTVQDDAGRSLAPLGSFVVDSANSDVSFKATGLFSRTAAGGNLLVNGVAAAAPPPVGDPARVVWNVAARFKVVTVPVAFHDLPMP